MNVDENNPTSLFKLNEQLDKAEGLVKEEEEEEEEEEEYDDEEDDEEDEVIKPRQKKYKGKDDLSVKVYDEEYLSLLKYPFKSKFKYLEKYIKHDHPHTLKEPYVHDFRLKDSKKLSKPNFSNEPGCWEADLMFVNYFDPKDKYLYERIYLILINVNTRFLIVEPAKSKKKEDIEDALSRAITWVDKTHSCIKTIKCDGEKAFVSLSNDGYIVLHHDKNELIYGSIRDSIGRLYVKKPRKVNELWNYIFHHKEDKEAIRKLYEDRMFLEKDEKFKYYFIKWVIDESHYTLAHKHVDAVIRTLRNAFGMDDRRLADAKLMDQMVDFYNNTPHSGLRFRNYQYDTQIDDSGEYVGSGLEKPKQTKWIYYTPRQVQENVDLEWRYIRMMRSKLQTIKNKMSLKGLLSYSPGNIILIHLEKGKTKKKHEKIRRVFNEIAVFFCYQNGNVICRLLKPYLNYTPQKDGPFKFHPSSNTSDKHIQVPIIYTKFVCKSIESLPKDYIEYFGLQNYFHKSDVPKSLTISREAGPFGSKSVRS